MTTITWKISQLDRNTADGYVTTAHWIATAVDGEHSASIYSTCSWPHGTVGTPYEQLTEQQVLDWVYASGVDKAATEAALKARIAEEKNPTSAQGLPWQA